MREETALRDAMERLIREVIEECGEPADDEQSYLAEAIRKARAALAKTETPTGERHGEKRT